MIKFMTVVIVYLININIIKMFGYYFSLLPSNAYLFIQNKQLNIILNFIFSTSNPEKQISTLRLFHDQKEIV